MNKKRVLITGSAGFVGSHLVEHLLEKTDWDIIGIDSFRHRGDSLRVYHNPLYASNNIDIYIWNILYLLYNYLLEYIEKDYSLFVFL